MTALYPEPFASLMNASRLAPCDYFFGKTLTPQMPLLGSYLLAIAREGHLCATLDGQKLIPSFGEWDAALIKAFEEVECEHIIQQGPHIYLKRNYDIEKKFLYHLHRLEQFPCLLEKPLPHPDLTDEQNGIVSKIMSRPVSWISGGPGTGKTFTAAILLEKFKGSAIAAAPTGKAASNLRKKLKDVPVFTLQSLLAKNEPITADLLVIDEGSMVDAHTYAETFAKIKGGSQVAIFGDHYQLPPVSSGNIFAACATNTDCLLTHCLRTNLKPIVDLAEAAREGKAIQAMSLSWPVTLKPGQTLLTPLRQGLFGVENLNRYFHAQHRCHRLPIIITQNAAHLDLYNGDTGYIENDQAIFDSVTLPKSHLPPYEMAYALSVHKSQGSEYDDVLVILPEGSEKMGREMLYTAITRAKKSIEIRSAEGVIEKVLSTKLERQSGLKSPLV